MDRKARQSLEELLPDVDGAMAQRRGILGRPVEVNYRVRTRNTKVASLDHKNTELSGGRQSLHIATPAAPHVVRRRDDGGRDTGVQPHSAGMMVGAMNSPRPGS
jgi:hypothetical protein